MSPRTLPAAGRATDRRSAAQESGAQESAAGGYLRVSQVRSSIGSKPKHRGTLRALGLRGIGSTRVLPDRPEVRGMIARVPHLVDLRPASEEEAAAEQARKAASRHSKPASKEGAASKEGPAPRKGRVSS